MCVYVCIYIYIYIYIMYRHMSYVISLFEIICIINVI